MVLGLIAFVQLWITVNPTSAILAIGALLFYVFVYTLVLKRSTPQNIVIGGAAGAVPALVGWSAVTGAVGLPALAMFGIIFYWTPPHFWALSMKYESQYKAANVPMMPVVYGREETAKHIVLYSFLLFAMCLVFFSVGRMGLLYLAAALVLNAVFIGRSHPAPAQPNDQDRVGFVPRLDLLPGVALRSDGAGPAAGLESARNPDRPLGIATRGSDRLGESARNPDLPLGMQPTAGSQASGAQSRTARNATRQRSPRRSQRSIGADRARHLWVVVALEVVLALLQRVNRERLFRPCVDVGAREQGLARGVLVLVDGQVVERRVLVGERVIGRLTAGTSMDSVSNANPCAVIEVPDEPDAGASDWLPDSSACAAPCSSSLKNPV